MDTIEECDVKNSLMKEAALEGTAAVFSVVMWLSFAGFIMCLITNSWLVTSTLGLQMFFSWFVINFGLRIYSDE